MPSDSTPIGSQACDIAYRYKHGVGSLRCYLPKGHKGLHFAHCETGGDVFWTWDEPIGTPAPPQEPPALTTTDGEGQQFWIAHDEYEQCAALRSEIFRLQEAASERDAIATLVSDRSEVGTYAKVEALEAEVSRLRAQIRETVEAWRNRAFNACADVTGLPGKWVGGLCPRCHCTPWAHAWRMAADELEKQLATDQESQG